MYGRQSGKLRISALREALRTSLWFLPGMMVLGVLGLVALTLAFDRSGIELPGGGFSGSPDSARAVLSAIAGSIVTLTALVFSVTIVVLQLASSQYSPRVLRTFLRDRQSQSVLGVFLSTFAYSLVTLRSVRGSSGTEDPAYVPQLSVTVSFGLTLLSLAFFVFYIHHIAQSMEASSIVAEVAAETSDAIERLYPATGDDAEVDAAETDPGAEVTVVLANNGSGYLQAVDEEALFEAARENAVLVRMLPAVGDFVAEGTRLFEVVGHASDEISAVLQRGVTLGRRRTMRQDAAFGFRQLVDIAEKALSPGINDPTTAVQAIDRLDELLLMLAPRRLPSASRADDDGAVRLVLPRPGWESYVRLAFDEIRQYGEGSVQVTRRLRAVAEDLVAVVPPARRAAVEEQLKLLERTAERGFDDREDVQHAKRESRHG